MMSDTTHHDFWLDILRKRMFYTGPDNYPDESMDWVRELETMGHAEQLEDGRWTLTEAGRIHIVPQAWDEFEAWEQKDS